MAVTHLIERGHQLIAYAGGPMSTPQVADRLARRAGMEEAGLDDDQLTVLLTNALTVDEGRRVSQRILGLPARRRPTAVFCANDLLALGVLQHMTQNGVAVPEAMSIVGYDDIEYAAAAAVAADVRPSAAPRDRPYCGAAAPGGGRRPRGPPAPPRRVQP